MNAPVRSGDIINGKYRIERVLGEGGMGVVVAAHHLRLDRRVAIKFLKPEMLVLATVVERFAREARAASSIESEHVARVTDVDELENGTPFMVMEYLEGADLSTVRESGHGLPVEVAVGYVLEACEAIGEAHRLGVVHRDIKPANLFLARRADGRTRVKVLDFGISKLNVEGSPSVTRTAIAMGSPEYMSPEQHCSARDVDARTDVWALGVTLYELLTAQVPFPGESYGEICACVLTQDAPSPATARPDLAPGLVDAILRCLRRDVGERFASIPELVDALRPYAASVPAGGSNASIGLDAPLPRLSVVSATLKMTAAGSGTVAGFETTGVRPAPSGRPWGALAIVVAVAALAAAAFTLADRTGTGRTSAAAPSADVMPPATPPKPSNTTVTPSVTPAASSSAPTPAAPPSARKRAPGQTPTPRPPLPPPGTNDGHTID